MKNILLRIVVFVLVCVFILLAFNCEEPMFTVLYSGNGNTGGTVPALGVTSRAGTMITVSGNTGSLVRTGYDFDGWNTQADGSGFPYAAGTSLIVPYGHAITLYARWVPKTYDVYFLSQGGTPAEMERTVTFDQPYGRLPVPTKAGFRFLGWYTSSDRTLAERVDEQAIHRIADHITLYAWWDDFVDAPYAINSYFQDIATDSYVLGQTRILYAPIGSEVHAELRDHDHFILKTDHPSHVPQGVVLESGDLALHLFYDREVHAVSFDAEGGTAVNPIAVRHEANAVLPTTRRNGYAFDGWWTAADKAGTQVTSSSPITGDITLHAGWFPPVSVTFDKIGGTDGTSAVGAVLGEPMPAISAPTRIGYTFGGYFDQPEGLGTQYYDENVESTQDWDKRTAATLYAKWIAPAGSSGGYIFIDKGEYSDGWRYMETAPPIRSMAGSPGFLYIYGYHVPVQGESIAFAGTDQTGIVGTGEQNTEVLVEAMEGNGYTAANHESPVTPLYAAKVCNDYTYHGFDDWFLPSKMELKCIHENVIQKGLSDYQYTGANTYWSSTEYGSPSPVYAWVIDLSTGEARNLLRGEPCRVWPVRAF
jgi:uncharacterized repeat protein (TIGR02543 family)